MQAQFFQDIFPTYYGFILSRSLYVICRLKVAELLEAGPLSAGEICQHLGIEQVTQLQRLMNFLCSKEIFSKDAAGLYAHTSLSRDLKRAKAGERIIQHQDRYWKRLAFPNQESLEALNEAECPQDCAVEALACRYILSRAIYMAVYLQLYSVRSPLAKHLQASKILDSSGLTEIGKLLLDRGCRAFILHDIPKRWQALEKLEEAIMQGVVPFERLHGTTIFEYLSQHPEETTTFSEAMTFISDYECQALVEELDGHLLAQDTVVDVGGGQGRYLSAILHRHPAANGILFDLQENIAQHSLSPELLLRTKLVPGDFFKEVPQADLYLFKRVLHDWSDEECVNILKTVAKAAKPHSRLLLHEFILPQAEALMLDVYFMVLFKGRQRTEADFAKILQESGWNLQTARQTKCWLGTCLATRCEINCLGDE